MTNLQAALGLAQMENLERFIAIKNENYSHYKNALAGVKGVRLLEFREDIRSNRWFYSLMLDDFTVSRDSLMQIFTEQKVGVRPIWTLIHTLTPYRDCEYHGGERSKKYRSGIINLPCSTSLTIEDVKRVCDIIKNVQRG